MLYQYPVIIFLILVTLFTRTVHAQSYNSMQMVELGVMVGAAWYQAKQKAPLLPQEIADEIDWPDEEEPDNALPVLYGGVVGLDVRVQGDKAEFRLSKNLPVAYSRLSHTMRNHSVSRIDMRSGQLDIFPEGSSKQPVSIIIPFENEPFMPVTGYDWLDQSEGLAFVHYRSMEAIAAIAEAALSMQARERAVGLDEQDESDAEDQVTLFEDLGGQLYAIDPLPAYPPESTRVEAKQEMDSIVLVLNFGIEIIKVHATQNSDRQTLGAFEHLVRKANGENDKKSSEDKKSEQGAKNDEASSSGDSDEKQEPESSTVENTASSSSGSGKVLESRVKQGAVVTREVAWHPEFGESQYSPGIVPEFKQRYPTKEAYEKELNRRLRYTRYVEQLEKESRKTRPRAKIKFGDKVLDSVHIPRSNGALMDDASYEENSSTVPDPTTIQPKYRRKEIDEAVERARQEGRGQEELDRIREEMKSATTCCYFIRTETGESIWKQKLPTDDDPDIEGLPPAYSVDDYPTQEAFEKEAYRRKYFPSSVEREATSSKCCHHDGMHVGWGYAIHDDGTSTSGYFGLMGYDFSPIKKPRLE